MSLLRRGARDFISAILLASALAAQAGKDSDGDGLSDEDEIHKYLTSPTNGCTAGNGVPDGDWTGRRAFTYTIRAVLRVMKPCDLGTNRDDFQDSAVLADFGNQVEMEIIAYPHRQGSEGARLPELRWKRQYQRAFSRLPENTDGRQAGGAMKEYLAPTRMCRWDEAMAARLREELAADGVPIEGAPDVDLVEWVAQWLYEKSACRTREGVPYLFAWQKGRMVLPGSAAVFYARNNPLTLPEWRWPFDPDWKAYSDLAFDGRRMLESRRYDWGLGWCVYVATALRALGIPVRFAQFVPLADADQARDLAMLREGVRPAPMRAFLEETLLADLAEEMAAPPWQVVTMNEVWVGGRWVLLNLPRHVSGVNFPATPFQPAVTPGLLLRIHTFADPSSLDYASTWGRKASGSLQVPGMPGPKPWKILGVQSHAGRHCRLMIQGVTNEAVPLSDDPWRPATAAANSSADNPVDRIVFTRALQEERAVAEDAFRAGLAAGQLMTSFPIPPSYRNTLDFKVNPKQFPRRSFAGAPEAALPGPAAPNPALVYNFFPVETPKAPDEGERRLRVEPVTNPARPAVLPSTNPLPWKILDAFWFDSERRPLPMPPQLGPADGGALFLICAARPTGEAKATEAFLLRAQRRFILAAGAESVRAILLPFYWREPAADGRDFLAVAIPGSEFKRMKPGVSYRLENEIPASEGAWHIAEGLVLRRE